MPPAGKLRAQHIAQALWKLAGDDVGSRIHDVHSLFGPGRCDLARQFKAYRSCPKDQDAVGACDLCLQEAEPRLRLGGQIVGWLGGEGVAGTSRKYEVVSLKPLAGRQGDAPVGVASLTRLQTTCPRPSNLSYGMNILLAQS
jgi:hypothetical protein